jgi:agarase
MVRRGAALLALVVLIAGSSSATQQGEPLGRYGGWLERRGAATGWFRTSKASGRWWLVDPDGCPFLSIGVNAVTMRPAALAGSGEDRYRGAVAAKYGRPSAWAEATTDRLRQWGFNTLGARCDRSTWLHGMPYTVTLDVAGLVGREPGCSFPDVFDPSYEAAVGQYVAGACRRLVRDPALIGYFTDSDPRWVPDESGRDSLFVEYLGRDDSAPGRRELLATLETWYLNIGELNRAWGTTYDSFEGVGRSPQVGSQIPDEDVEGFVRVVAERYFQVAHDAIRAVDETHLILGCRFDAPPPRAVLEAMGDYVDVVSFSQVGGDPPAIAVREIHRITGKPVIVTEFGFPRAKTGPDAAEKSDAAAALNQACAEWYESYVMALLALPMVVGYHWSDHADCPVGLPAADERGTQGLVDLQDVPHAEFAETVSRVNRSAYRLASGAEQE